ncbi:hypothetical protein [Frankia sp. Cas4]|uniref:PIN-like domain-containing protein n=1 Tax=Frankia sp. Cas4 TaxID=3073927 RepID=UPI002AD3B9E6|nr:hypothetical protein [Frankia sp. Cas4]
MDENTLPLGKNLAAVRGDVVFPGHCDTCIQRGDLDDVWLPIIGAAGLLLITRDRRIRYRLMEKRLLRLHSVKGLFLTQAGNMNMREILTMVMRHWDQIDALAAVPGPWAKSLTRVGISDLTLPD